MPLVGDPLRSRVARISSPTIVASLIAFALLSGCALDTRKLSQVSDSANGGSGGTSNGGGGGGQRTSGGGSSTPVEIPVCTYSDETVSADCDTLTTNPGFTKSTDGWKNEPIGMQISWAKDDASDDPSSGSIVVTNQLDGADPGLATGAGMQCVPISVGTTYVMAGDIFIPAVQETGFKNGEPSTGRAGLGLLFWRGEGCLDTNYTLGSAVTELVGDTDKWMHVEGSGVAPEGAESMSVRVLTAKDYRQFRFKALFDNVLLQAR